ncbi:PepSY-associated TM helix domain-containing protein [Allopusillimonas ginsengisoli]|uniref:PepSY-associated TM helix domain-containing protein n=1 Tax=Allopusillimonas ginsengisoli TaxID=453575 RepID=UPI0010C20411|nr:PepSY domain-containing protein [Allopusillimonas ginsengisoli]
MKETFRQSMAWLHTWSGLLTCWVLLLVFVSGSASYFRDEITLWMQPELHEIAATHVSTVQAAQTAVDFLKREAPNAPRWFITLPNPRTAETRAGWISSTIKDGQERRVVKQVSLNPATGERLANVRTTRGGDFLYRLHYELHYMPRTLARWIVAFCAMFMLVAIISGIITHKRIFKDFFTFRPRKGQRSWMDAHNVVAVLALPYHLMITYTGLVTLMFIVMPSPIQLAYEGNEKAFFAEVFPQPKISKLEHQSAALLPIAPLITKAQAHWHGGQAGRVFIDHPGDAMASINVIRSLEKGISSVRQSVQFNGATGALIATIGDDPSTAAASRGVLFGLHVANFANPLLRVLFFLSGLAGCIMVATGALLWAVKERQRCKKTLAQGRLHFGLRLVDGLNIGAIAGLPIALGAYFWSNRLLPVVLENRAVMEINSFFLAWGAAALLAQIRPNRRMWQWQLSAGGVLFTLLPALNAITTHSHLGVTLLQGKGPWPVAGFDLFSLGLGLALVYAAKKLGSVRKPIQLPLPQKRHNREDRAVAQETS